MTPFIPATKTEDLRGVMALLSLIGNPQSEVAAKLLDQLSAEKEEAVAAAKAAAEDRVVAEQLHAAAAAERAAVEVPLVEREARLREREEASNKNKERIEQWHNEVGQASKNLADRELAYKVKVEEFTRHSTTWNEALARREKDLVVAEQAYADNVARLDNKRKAFMALAEAAKQAGV
jgi:hypothetical protein